MRDYAKVSPKMWHGKTIKTLRKCPEGLVVGLYLMTSPQSNMLGLFMQPLMYMAYETGMTLEGASKGLHHCIDAGFCSYDEASEFVWVHEMARYQIADDLKTADLRCKGIQKEYDSLPENPFLGAFFDRYASSFNMKKRRPEQAPTKPLRSQEQEQEQEQEKEQAISESKLSGGKPPADQSKTELWHSAVSLLSTQGMPEAQARSFVGKLSKDYPGDDIVLGAVRAAVTEQPADARAYLRATCQRLSGERKRSGAKDWTENAL